MIKKNIPNLFTLCNLLCGCIAIVFAFQGDLVWSAYLVGIACVFDFIDGFAARILKTSSELGKQLDSLADMVSFGVVPGIVVYQMVVRSLNFAESGFELIEFNKWITFIPFSIILFSAIRLAKFNIDTKQSESFIGVPTPANAILFCSIPLIVNWGKSFSYDQYNSYYTDTILINPYFLIVLSLIMSFLLVAPLPLFALKFKNFSWADNKIRFIFLALSFVLLIVFQFVGIPLIIILYIVLSVINNFLLRSKTQS